MNKRQQVIQVYIMKKYTFLFLTILFVHAIYPAIVQANRTVKIGVYQNVPLTFIEDDGKVKGFFIDIIEHIASRENWDIEYIPASWPQCLKNLKDGKIDLLGVIAYSEERNKVYDYTYESFLTEWGQIYIYPGAEIESIIDLKGKKIAVLQKDMHFIYLKKLTSQFGIQCRYIEAFEYEDVLGIVETGKCSAGLVGKFYGMQHEKDYDIKKSPIVISPQKLYYAAPKDKNKDILSVLDSHIRKLKNNDASFYYQSIDKWFGVGKPMLPKWFTWVAVSASTLLVLFLIISLVFRTQVKRKTRELTVKTEELTAEIEQRKLAVKERAGLELKLQRAQKMEAIGTLAGGVAHDLNNILSGIVSYPELLLLDIPDDSPLRKPIMTIKESGEKAAVVVQDLLTLARRGVAIIESVDLNHIIEEYLKSPEFQKLKSYHLNIEIETKLDRKLFKIMGSSVHLSKTVMNLISNASEAMPFGGKILIHTENRYVDTPLKDYDDIEEGDYVVLTISDSGIGISSEDRERIFEPFYTKKVMGRSGTGLGMAVVWGTVKDHHGYINVHSKEGQGTIITLYFPAARHLIDEDKIQLAVENYLGNGESVLIVDDVAEQREIASAMLSKLGYSVLSVSSGEEAIDFLKNKTADILVLDMIMEPGMDGLETYKKIIEFRPGQKAIIASGFSETNRVKEAQRLGVGRYVKKPYTIEKIGMAVRYELDNLHKTL